MNWYGDIAFSEQVEVEPGITEDHPVIKHYYGELTRDSKRDTVSGINTDITLVNILRVVADPYLTDNFHKILYVKHGGSKWRVSSVEETFPTLTLHFGSLYKGEDDANETGTTSEAGRNSW